MFNVGPGSRTRNPESKVQLFAEIGIPLLGAPVTNEISVFSSSTLGSPIMENQGEPTPQNKDLKPEST